MDVSLECLATTQGNVHRTYHLNPVEQKSGIYKSKINALASHSGFAEKLCGGDITLGFNHCSKTGNHNKAVLFISLLFYLFSFKIKFYSFV